MIIFKYPQHLQAMDNNRNTDEFAKRAKAYVEHNYVLNADKIKEISCLFNELFNYGKSNRI